MKTSTESEQEKRDTLETEQVKDAYVSGDDFSKDYQTPEKILEAIRENTDEDKNIAINITFDYSKINKFGKTKIGGNFNNQNVANDNFQNDETQDININKFILLVTLSVLNGSKLEIFFEESQNLKNLFSQKSSKFDEVDLFDSEENLLETLKVLEEESEDNTEYGKTPTKVLRFEDEKRQNSILLEEFWKIKLNLRESLLEWITELGRHNNAIVRLKAADALGKIICFDKSSFDLVIRTVLVKWADSSKQSIKRLVGRTLSFGISDSGEGILDNQILGLLHFWITQDNFRLRQTATLVFYSDIGLNYPDRAIKSFNKVSEKEDYSLFLPIAETMVDLFNLGKYKSELYKVILNTLNNWTKKSKRKMHYELSQIILLMIMKQHLFDENRTSWKTLIWLIKSDKEFFGDLISSIFRNSLFGEKRFPDLIFGEMRIWLETCEKEFMYVWLRYLIYLIIRDGKDNEAKRFIAYLKWWKDSFKIDTAERIFKELKPHWKIEYQTETQN